MPYLNMKITDFKLVDALLTTYTAFIQAQSILVDMDAMMQELNLQEADLREQYGFFYEGMATSWQDIRDALDWTIEFKKEIDKYQPNDEFVKCILFWRRNHKEMRYISRNDSQCTPRNRQGLSMVPQSIWRARAVCPNGSSGVGKSYSTLCQWFVFAGRVD